MQPFCDRLYMYISQKWVYTNKNFSVVSSIFRCYIFLKFLL